MAEISASQSVKQSAKSMGRSFSDRLKIASAKTSGTNTKDIDIALVKSSTSRFHVVPKEKHVVTLKHAISTSKLNASYVAGGLLKRLHSATDWLTALKTLMVVHRLIRETDAAAFMEELLRAGDSGARGRGGRVLSVDNFLDTSNVDGRFDYSEWVRAYGKYLDESLDVFSAVAWHVELESAGKESKMRSLSPKDLLQQMPYLQRLQRRLIDCLPRGQAAQDDVVLMSLSMVVRESFKLYKALSEGIINLADCFFTMEYLDAVKGLEVYREAIASGEALAGYYSTLQNLHTLKSGELPTISQPPSDFLEAMEAYAKDAPRVESGGAASASAGGEGGEKTAATAAAGSASVPRRTVPLRKGRMALQSHAKPGPVPGDYELGGVATKDLGMLLPSGVTKPATPTPTSPETMSPRKSVEESTGEVVDQPPAEPAVEAPPIIDLLGFDDEPGPNQQQESAEVVPQSQQTQPSALDLLSELDFGGLSFGDSNAAQAAQQPATTPVQPAIPDAFVVRAAADVYGRPPPLHEALQQPQLSPAMTTPGGGYYTPQAAPWAATAAPPVQQPQPLQYSYNVYPTAQQPQQQLYGYGQAPVQSPAASGIYGVQQWESYGTTPPGGRDPQLIRQAGAHDPFSALPGLPAGAAKSPPQNGTPRGGPGMAWS